MLKFSHRENQRPNALKLLDEYAKTKRNHEQIKHKSSHHALLLRNSHHLWAILRFVELMSQNLPAIGAGSSADEATAAAGLKVRPGFRYFIWES